MATRDYTKRSKRTPPVAGLADIRAALGLTQTAVCERVEAITNKTFTKGALSALELGHRGASAETLAAVEQALGLRASALRTDYDPSHDRRKQDEVAA